jgi:hypothetical protein
MAVTIAIAAAYLMVVPATADPAISAMLDAIGAGVSGTLTAAAALLLVPLSLLGMFSPVAIRLLTSSTAESGRVAGAVYGISTIGNVFGTLLTTFMLIPAIGSRAITYLFAGVLGLCSVSLFLVPRKIE